jgi:hypothetical protein
LKGLLLDTGITTRGIFLLDERGFVILVEPDQPGVVGTPLPVYEEIGPTLHAGLPMISSLADAPALGHPVAFAAVPIVDDFGNPLGSLAAAIDVDGSIIDDLIKPITLGELISSERSSEILSRTL